jgi:hypothetical protein
MELFILIRTFITERIRYNRNIDKNYEDYWNIMIGGNAVQVEQDPKKKFTNFIFNIVSIFLAFIGLGTIGFGTDNMGVFLGFFAAIIILPMISNAIFLNVIKITWLKFVLCFGVAFVLGLILGLIALAF